MFKNHVSKIKHLGSDYNDYSHCPSVLCVRRNVTFQRVPSYMFKT